MQAELQLDSFELITKPIMIKLEFPLSIYLDASTKPLKFSVSHIERSTPPSGAQETVDSTHNNQKEHNDFKECNIAGSPKEATNL